MSISNPLKNDLLLRPAEQVFQKHVIDGNSYFFKSLIGSIDNEYQLRNELSNSLAISINDVIIVGSAKLGFSIKTKEFKAFDSLFKETRVVKNKSDIDVAIVNKARFEKINFEIYNLSRHFDEDWINNHWKVNRYTQGISKNLFNAYTKNHARGWIQPNLMPEQYLASNEWISVCENWRTKLKRKIRVGFYSDWVFFKNYQMDQLLFIKSQIEKLEV